MKYTTTLLLPFLLCFLSFPSFAQNNFPDAPDYDGAYPIEQNDADHPCITATQYEQLEARCAHNVRQLGLSDLGPENRMTTPLNWPLRSANGLMDCNYYGISAYVDQNTTTGVVQDYNCGTKTYDGHRGTDISIWPFPFYKMDHDQVEVIAAAAGTIIDKSDGNFDKNCGSNNLAANYLVIQHADGSRILYFHMKKNSLTAKAIGASVAQGEYLGVVGSSGNSSGPHLHFEVWSGSTVSTRVDPYAGPCNTLNANSWWAAQKPYAAAEILKTSVHTTDANLPACPATEIPNESTCYSLPFQGAGLPAGAAKFYVFIRYETAGLTGNLSILNPDSTIFSTWTFTSSSSVNASLKSWTKTLPTQSGTYTFQSSYNGITCSKKFDVIGATITPSGPTTFCQGNSVVLSANAASTYLWNTGATTQSITVATAGSYAVTVTNTNSCSAVSTATTVTINPAPAIPIITAGGPTVFCQGNSVMLSASAANSYTWSNGATTQSIPVSTSGNYTVAVTNANGCSATSAATAVTVNPLPVAAITPNGPTTFCQGNSVMLNASAASTYSWSNGATTQAINVSTTGSYTVTISNINGCTASSTPTSVTVNPLPAAPSISANGPTTFCQGNSVMLNASTANTYSWSNGATTQAINVSTTGSYTVTISNVNGCTASSTPTSVTVNPLPAAPTVSANGPTTFCQGNSVILNTSAANTYTWSNGATTQAINVSTTGSYTVTISNANGCTASSTPTSVTVNPLPAVPGIAANGPTTFCQGNSVMLNASASSTYSWSNGATTQAINVSTTGSYTVTIGNANGCTASSAPTTVTVNPLPTAPTITPDGPTSFCQGYDVLLSASAANAYFWSNGATTQSINISISGDYTVTISNANGCSAASAPTSVTVNPAPPPSTITPNGPTVFCQGNTVLLSAPAAAGYFWTTGAMTQSITVTTSGNYSVTVINANGCYTVSDPITVTVNPLPPVPSITANGALLSSSAATGNQWYFNGNPIPGATSQTYTATQSGPYTIQTTNANGCTATSAVFNFINTGIEIVDVQNTLLLVPNPNQGTFTLEISSESVQLPAGEIEIYNLMGEKIWTGEITGRATVIDITTQPAGIYFASVSLAGGKKVLKVIKS